MQEEKTEKKKDIKLNKAVKYAFDIFFKNETAFALGCPAMGAEVLEESEMEPFVTELEASVSGKTIGLFGSYGWGDGEWMRDWVDRMTAAGATVAGGEGVICQDAPDDDAKADCEALGKSLAAV